MKVIYVLPDIAKGKANKEVSQALKSIKIGNTYTVVFDDGKYYELEEFKCKKKNDQILWDKNCFVPLENEEERLSYLCDKLEELAEKLTRMIDGY